MLYYPPLPAGEIGEIGGLKRLVTMIAQHLDITFLG